MANDKGKVFGINLLLLPVPRVRIMHTAGPLDLVVRPKQELEIVTAEEPVSNSVITATYVAPLSEIY